MVPVKMAPAAAQSWRLTWSTTYLLITYFSTAAGLAWILKDGQGESMSKYEVSIIIYRYFYVVILIYIAKR
jgi:hypothetical protein